MPGVLVVAGRIETWIENVVEGAQQFLGAAHVFGGEGGAAQSAVRVRGEVSQLSAKLVQEHLNDEGLAAQFGGLLGADGRLANAVVERARHAAPGGSAPSSTTASSAAGRL